MSGQDAQEVASEPVKEHKLKTREEKDVSSSSSSRNHHSSRDSRMRDDYRRESRSSYDSRRYHRERRSRSPYRRSYRDYYRGSSYRSDRDYLEISYRDKYRERESYRGYDRERDRDKERYLSHSREREYSKRIESPKSSRKRSRSPNISQEEPERKRKRKPSAWDVSTKTESTEQLPSEQLQAIQQAQQFAEQQTKKVDLSLLLFYLLKLLICICNKRLIILKQKLNMP